MQSHRKPDHDRGLHVLVVEPDPIALGQTSAMLLAEGADISTARSAVGLVDRVTRTMPDLILMDVLMPDMETRELAQLANLCRRGAPALVVYTKVLRPMLRRVIDVRVLYGIIPKSGDDAEFLRLYREVTDRLESELPTQIFTPHAAGPVTSGTYAMGGSSTPDATRAVNRG
jgi:CheY-like chemotaxis protein